MSIGLNTAAEQAADQSRELPGFKRISLPGIKEQVAEILSLIGRGGCFSTYTVHDISHIDAMLNMLDWLVPESTGHVMTSVDWLLITLSIYLHDLGMVTTSEEYDRRSANSNFTNWFNTLDKTSEGRDYLARTNRMSPQEREIFFFQEFIRKEHAQRIREWITGRHSQAWGAGIAPIAGRIAELMKELPSRFREYLGLVCESHHRADLEKTDIYPLVARFGNHPAEVANVQYAAVLLRTADLLHVTKDRTPSIMYQTIQFSDPKSVEEWDKQLGSFAVGPKGRRLIEEEPNTAIIVINADFTEERPLFALQEYIAYADSQILQNKRWIDNSQESPDGADYNFPWHKVDGDVRLEGVPPQAMRFELDRGQLLDLLVGHTIYNDPTVAVRELLQNSIDAVRYQAHLDEREALSKKQELPEMGKVIVEWSPLTRELVVRDNGTGMDRDIIKHHLMSVGSSYYNTPQFESEHADFVPISRFGIGILTCFMVSDDIEIITFKNNRGHRIRMTSVKSNYLLREIESGDTLTTQVEPHGTRVKLRLRDTVDLPPLGVLGIVRHWIVIPECEVEYREPGTKPVRVGFRSAEDALRSYRAPYLREGEGFDGDGAPIAFSAISNSHIVVKSSLPAGSASPGHFEMAFETRAGYFPERAFVHDSARSSMPKVCIEGIRVSNALPGCEQHGGFAALLSVRGSRRFRTTVSRSGLEIDDEYIRVGSLCAEMFFEHVADEENRIANKPGRPLSQAATAVGFLVAQLQSISRGGPVAELVKRLADNQRSIVVEKVDSGTTKPAVSRELVSPKQVRETPIFWTLESRSVDSLGIMSRDLGRDLSLNEFLLAFAPDLTHLKYSPLIPDAHWSRDAIRSIHRAERVEFSFTHQQSAIKWVAGKEDIDIDLNETVPRELLPRLWSTLGHHGRHSEDSLRIDLDSADIVGDSSEICAVLSRIVPIISKNSFLEQIWTEMRVAIGKLSLAGELDDVICVWVAALAFVEVLKKARRNEQYYGEDSDSRWRGQVHRLREIMRSLGSHVELPDTLREHMNVRTVFDATSFWRDWDERVSGN